MAYKTLVLGASYGSLLGTKLLMAGHDVTLVCRRETADLINAEGTEVRIKLRDEDEHRAIRSGDQPGKLDATTPGEVDLAQYDMVALAMQEPQYGSDDIAKLLSQIAEAGLPCLSIMNMPPLPYLRRIPGVEAAALRDAFSCPDVWSAFTPGNVTLCSPDPQAFRLPDEGPNVLFVGLPTNFKAARFEKEEHNEMLRQMEADIAAVRLDGKDVPVKLRVSDSLFVPLAKWSMLLTGNYRCVKSDGVQPIKEAVHGDADRSEAIYEHVNAIARKLGADAGDQVPFAKYAAAAQNLLKPSSVARAIDGGAENVERVDMVVKLIGDSIGMSNADVDAVVDTVNTRIASNRRIAA
ncbi:hypothetical protein BV394_11865 [Brevirhabdus pacifica]|uniref:Uncharacterized protein n=1 Tax=Brevirhabdus pacifica TaxID=1267768 RepID=A0A1U7DKD8_9RHOB|nr:2-dehydropantoate 2-reductase N-terminal domain-containing protein [Brevirhabdus pacifica]APX90338.1 hypothetical protein BV394_11865 [Brevirhabdus pacifica]OWU78624.1 acetyl-CoA carboxylase [Loktanella sp. 22II-4b]PJJ80791.1 ketopantoate reductase [Brevirhabdus pacifica]